MQSNLFNSSYHLESKKYSTLKLHYNYTYFFLIKDALDELNGRTYDGRELRIKIDEGRPK